MPRGEGLHLAPVAQDGDPVAHLEQLLEPMRDVEDGHPARLEAGDDPEQPVDLRWGQRRGRLVEDQHLALGGERFGDLQQLHLGHTERLHPRPRRDLQPDLREHGLGIAEEPREVHHSGATGQALEEDVLGDGEIGEEIELLVDDPDPGPDGGHRAPRSVRLAFQQDGALVRLVQAAEQLHQRRLAGAVLAGEDVYLPAADRKIHPVQCEHPGEALRRPLELDDVRRGGVAEIDQVAIREAAAEASPEGRPPPRRSATSDRSR